MAVRSDYPDQSADAGAIDEVNGRKIDQQGKFPTKTGCYLSQPADTERVEIAGEPQTVEAPVRLVIDTQHGNSAAIWGFT